MKELKASSCVRESRKSRITQQVWILVMIWNFRKQVEALMASAADLLRAYKVVGGYNCNGIGSRKQLLVKGWSKLMGVEDGYQKAGHGIVIETH